MVQSRWILILVLFGALGCSKATPTFDLLDEGAIPMPRFNGATVKNLSATSGSQEFTINGECDRKITSIKAQVAGVTTTFTSLSDFSVTAPVIACSSTGTFTFKLKSLSALGFTNLTDGTRYEVRLRGMTSSGLSRASVIYITYGTGLGNKHIRIAGGGVHGGGDDASRAQDATFKAEISVSHTAKQDPLTSAYPAGGGFILRTGADSN